jgi:hypothetical protein
MSTIAIGTIIFACIFSGSMLGMFLRSRLPESHLSTDSKDLIKLAMGVLGTMAALVLALLISSAKASYDTQRGEVIRMAADFVELDRVLARYGAQTRDARGMLRSTLITGIGEIWPKDSYKAANLDSTATRANANRFFENLQQLKPADEYQRTLQAQAMQISADLTATHSLLLEQTQGSIPIPFLVILVFWLTVIFIGFGLFAPANPTVAGALVLSSLSIAAAIFLILELDRPFEGIMRISDIPLRNAVVYLSK